MKKIKFKKWIPKEYENSRILAGTNRFEQEFTHNGIFHAWGVAHEEYEHGAGNYSVALVELPDGTVKEMLPSSIQFVEPTVIETKNSFWAWLIELFRSKPIDESLCQHCKINEKQPAHTCTRAEANDDSNWTCTCCTKCQTECELP